MKQSSATSATRHQDILLSKWISCSEADYEVYEAFNSLGVFIWELGGVQTLDKSRVVWNLWLNLYWLLYTVRISVLVLIPYTYESHTRLLIFPYLSLNSSLGMSLTSELPILLLVSLSSKTFEFLRSSLERRKQFSDFQFVCSLKGKWL